MGNCKDCKYWKHKIDPFNRAWHECDAFDEVELTDKIGEADASLYVEALDSYGISVGLKTGPLFGCTYFRRKGS